MIWQMIYTHKLPKLCSATLKTENEQLKTKCRNLEEQLQLQRKPLQDKNMERSSHDERSATAASSRNKGYRKGNRVHDTVQVHKPRGQLNVSECPNLHIIHLALFQM